MNKKRTSANIKKSRLLNILIFLLLSISLEAAGSNMGTNNISYTYPWSESNSKNDMLPSEITYSQMYEAFSIGVSTDEIELGGVDIDDPTDTPVPAGETVLLACLLAYTLYLARFKKESAKK